MQQALTTQTVIIMTKAEAEAATAELKVAIAEGVTKIGAWLDRVSAKLLDIDEREGWKALGYRSMAAYVAAQYGGSRRNAYNVIARLRTTLQLVPGAAEDSESVNPVHTLVSGRQARALRDPALLEQAMERTAAGETPRAAAESVTRARFDDGSRAYADHDDTGEALYTCRCHPQRQPATVAGLVERGCLTLVRAEQEAW